jgi:hypothetical protein
VSTTTLVAHLDRAALDRLLHDGSTEVEVSDTEAPHDPPIGTMLVTADLDQREEEPDAWKQGAWEMTYAEADFLAHALERAMHDGPGAIRLAVDDRGHVRVRVEGFTGTRHRPEWLDLGSPERETGWCPDDLCGYCHEVVGRRTVGHPEDPYEAVRLDCGHEVVDLGDGPSII